VPTGARGQHATLALSTLTRACIRARVLAASVGLGRTNCLDAPDESGTPDKTQADVVHMGGTTAARLTLQPGWSWAECIKPVVGGASCQLTHLGVLQSGTMRIIHEDVTEVEIGPGETYVIEPGHQAEVVGDEPVVGYEFQPDAAEQYARQ
jgi:hypothetical protein